MIGRAAWAAVIVAIFAAAITGGIVDRVMQKVQKVQEGLPLSSSCTFCTSGR